MFHGCWQTEQQQQQQPQTAHSPHHAAAARTLEVQQQQQLMLSARLRCQSSPRLDKKTKAHLTKLLLDAANRAWCRVHGKSLPPPKLPPVVLRVIGEWFKLVDDDASGTLEHHELLAALQAARIPCNADSITEMIRLMDANRDGCISWAEFERFMMAEFAAGQQLLSGEFVLPSGMALPFGDIIRQLKRAQMLADVTGGGEARRKWMFADINLTAAAAEIAQAEEAIKMQKAFNETLHTARLGPAKQQQQQQQQQRQQQQQQDLDGLSGRMLAPQQTTMCAHSSGGVVASNDMAGRPVVAAGDGAASPRTDCDSSRQPWQKPDRLQLTGMLFSEGRVCGSSSGHKQSVGLLSTPQAVALLSYLPGSLQQLHGSPQLASSRSGEPNGGLANIAKREQAEAACVSSARLHRIAHMMAAAGHSSCTPGVSRQSARGRHAASPSQDEWCTAAASCLARRQSCGVKHAAVQDNRNGSSSSSSCHHRPGVFQPPRGAVSTAQPPPEHQHAASEGCRCKLRPWEHASAPASSSAARNSRACAGPAGTPRGVSKAVPEHCCLQGLSTARLASAAATADRAAVSHQDGAQVATRQQHGQQREGRSSHKRPAAQQQPHPVRPGGTGDVLAASRESLLSARARPPGLLLAPSFVGPVAAAITVAHTPRSQR